MTLFAIVLYGVIDQIDAGQAFVEWEGAAFGYVPTALLPPDAKEGDAITLRVRRPRKARSGERALIELPVEVPVRRGAVRASVRHARPKAGNRRDHAGDP